MGDKKNKLKNVAKIAQDILKHYLVLKFTIK